MFDGCWCRVFGWMKAPRSVVLDPCDNDHDQPVATANLDAWMSLAEMDCQAGVGSLYGGIVHAQHMSRCSTCAGRLASVLELSPVVA